MKGVLVFICAVIAHVNSQCGCGCSPSAPPFRPLPPCPRPQPVPRPLCPRPLPCPPSPPPCPPPVPICPRPLPPCPRPLLPPCPRPLPPCPRPTPCERPVPIIEVCDYNQAVALPFIQSPVLQAPVLQQPIVSYGAVSPYTPVALPSCNCPTPPSLPVSQLYTNFPSVLPPYALTSGLGISSCLGGVADLSVPAVSPVGLINPFLPAASPLSALAPTVSSLYPPINPCGCGCNYLKKIPIPPPFI